MLNLIAFFIKLKVFKVKAKKVSSKLVQSKTTKLEENANLFRHNDMDYMDGCNNRLFIASKFLAKIAYLSIGL